MIDVRTEQISPWKLNPRSNCNEESLAELAASIKEAGLLQPITVRPAKDPDREEMVDPKALYIIVAGERRYRAAIMAELEIIPAIVAPVNRDKALEIAIIENLQREDISAIEEARAFKTYLDNTDLTQTEFAEKIGKSQGHVANRLRLLKLPDEVQDKVISGEINATAARSLVKVVEIPNGIEDVIEKVNEWEWEWEEAAENVVESHEREKRYDEKQAATREQMKPELDRVAKELRDAGKTVVMDGAGKVGNLQEIYRWEIDEEICNKCDRRAYVLGVRTVWQGGEHIPKVMTDIKCPDPECYARQKKEKAARQRAQEKTEASRRKAEEKPRKEFAAQLVEEFGTGEFTDLMGNKHVAVARAAEVRYIAYAIMERFHVSDKDKRKFILAMGWAAEEGSDCQDLINKKLDASDFDELLRACMVWRILEEERNLSGHYWGNPDDGYHRYLKAKGFQDPNEKPAPEEEPAELEEATV